MNEVIELHERFSEMGRNARKWVNECKMLLPKIKRFQVWKEMGFSSIYEYAFKVAGLNSWQVTDALRIMKHIKDRPAMLKVAREKGLGRVRSVVTLLTDDNEVELADKAMNMPKNTLEVYAREARRGRKEFEEIHGDGKSGPRTTFEAKNSGNSDELVRGNEGDAAIVSKNSERDLVIAQMGLSKETASRLKKIHQGNWEETIKMLLEMRDKQLEAEKPAVKENGSRHIPNDIRRFVEKRSNGVCEAPNCEKKADHLHHTKAFSIHKEHDADYIVALCKEHHNLAHRGLVQNEQMHPRFWKILTEGQVQRSEARKRVDEKVQFYQRC